MSETKEKTARFLGTYFDRDHVLSIARLAGIFSWIALGIYILSAGTSFAQFMIQYVTGVFFQKGMSVADHISFFIPYLLQLLTGLLYFAALKFVQQALVILLDIEDNTRRAARV